VWQNIIAYLGKIKFFAQFILLAITALLLAFMYPDDRWLDIDFGLGRVWQGNNIVAPFTFPIQKFPEEIEREREALNAQMLPIFQLNDSVQIRQTQLFVTQYKKYKTGALKDTTRLNSRDSVQINLGKSIIKSVYNKGMANIPSKFSNYAMVEVVRNQVSRKVKVDSFYNQREALAFVYDTLSHIKSVADSKWMFNTLSAAVSEPNIVFDSALTVVLRDQKIAKLLSTNGVVNTGEIIVSKNALIDTMTYRKLITYREQYLKGIGGENNWWTVFLGRILLFGSILGVFFIYLKGYEPKALGDLRQLLFISLMMLLFAYLGLIVGKIDKDYLYAIPWCFLAIVLRNFYNWRLALLIHLILITIVSFYHHMNFQFMSVMFVVGMAVIITKVKTRFLKVFALAVMYILLAYTLAFIGFEIALNGHLLLEQKQWISTDIIRWSVVGLIIVSMFMSLLAYPIVPLLERLVGFTSGVTLAELSDLNNPLLKRLSIEAPGTFQHSLQVGNLAEAAASEIGANALLVKVGALYHDIGKMIAPKYFIENQEQINPHDELSYEQSASIIISHVPEGEKMAKKAGLPQVLIDFILTHHGTTRVEYFYRKKLMENELFEVNEKQFRYPGPRPSTKEQTILMLADAIEATSKSLKNPSEQDIDDLVNKITQEKIAHGQLKASELSFQELETVKSIFKKVMKSIHHVRVEYPDAPKEA
jgi:putative nucleotidyltransferase with HDIG domain